MAGKLIFELFRDNWLLHTEAIADYAIVAQNMMAGHEVSTGMMSSLQLPEVPQNVALVSMVGALTKSDVCDSEGSRSLSMRLQAAAADPSIDAIIMLSESCPGGQVDGTETLSNALRQANKVKPVYGVVSGMACSAATWVLSGCRKVFATSSTDMIGCIGVMARVKKDKAEADQKYTEVVSDLSPDKNSEFKNVEILKESYLNPVAAIFHQAVISGRGDRLKLDKENVLSGKTYIAGAAVKNGLIDGIASFETIVKMALKDAKTIRA